MSETMSAARIPLDGSIPRPPLFGISSVATLVTENLRGGAVVVPYPQDIPKGHDPCDAVTLGTKDAPDELAIPDGFPVFTAYLGEVCTAYNIGDFDEWQARANVALAARTDWALERQLMDASFKPTLGDDDVPHLADANAEVLNSGAALAAAVAVALLDERIAYSGGEGVLHLTPGVVTYLGLEKFRVDGSILRTASGTPVIVGQGYSQAGWGLSPSHEAEGPEGEAAAAQGQSWIYATGRPQYQLPGAIIPWPPELGEALDRETNEVVYRAERDLWVGWDGQLQAAVLADWSP